MAGTQIAPPLRVGSPQFSNQTQTISPDSQAAVDETLTVLQAKKDMWVGLDIDERIIILDEISRDLQTVSRRWVAAGSRAKGISPDNSFAEGEEWVFLAAIFKMVRLLRKSLLDIKKYGRPKIPGGLFTRPDGQAVARVFPQTLLNRLLFPGTRAEIRMEPGLTPEEITRTQAAFYRNPAPRGTVALVLGAGNVSSLVPGDFLHALFVKGQVVVLKPNPVNAYLAPLIEEGFQALIQRGFLKIICGGVAEGVYLAHHPAVETIHLTGSDKTFEAIIFGPGAEGAQRKIERRPLLNKPFTAELGNVSPIIVTPGPWTEKEIRAQATKIATWLVVNSGFNCLTPRVIIQSKNWALREALNRAIGKNLAQAKTRAAYYPGAKTRHAQFVEAHPDARQFGSATGNCLPWTYITDVDAANRDDICFRSEVFCGLMAETALTAADVPIFIEQAVDFANDTLWGTLTATLMVHPKSLKEPQVAAAIERAIANLRYGTVLLNQYGGYGYFMMLTAWGGIPGHDMYNVQSGIGMVNNALMFEHPQKSVVYSPFIQTPDPFSLTFKNFNAFGKRMVDLEISPSLGKMPGLLWEILRG